MRNHLGRTIGGLLLLTGTAFPQTHATTAFEAASFKPAAALDMAKVRAAILNGEAPKAGMYVGPGRVEFIYADLKDLISVAYKLKPYEITGPDWMAQQRFDIIAKFPAGATRDDIPHMLQALLKERLKLDAHVESKEHPVLALVVGKGALKLRESTETPAAIDENAPLKAGETKIDDPDGQVRMSVDPKTGGAIMNMGVRGTVAYKLDPTTESIHLDARQMTMGGFAELLTQFSQMGGTGARTVVDMTELKGHYQLALDISLADLRTMARIQGMDELYSPVGGAAGGGLSEVGTPSDPSGGTSLFAAVQSLGLRLEQRKAVTPQLVIDHVEKTPTEN
jgi:uncharacterized protein (TIGR03435 family)